MPMNKEPVTKAEDQIAESVTEAHRCLDTMYDVAIGKVDLPTLSTYCSQFTIAVLLEELRRHDQQRADELILWINEALEDGATAGELVWDWHAQIGRGHAPTNVGPYSAEQPPLPAEARKRTIPTSGGTIEVFAIEADTPGLLFTQYVCQYIADSKPAIVAGRWTITHADSGRSVSKPATGWPLDVARAIASELGELGVDWTRSTPGLAKEFNRDSARALARIFRSREDCRYCTDADHAVTAWRATPSTEAGAA